MVHQVHQKSNIAFKYKKGLIADPVCLLIKQPFIQELFWLSQGFLQVFIVKIFHFLFIIKIQQSCIFIAFLYQAVFFIIFVDKFWYLVFIFNLDLIFLGNKSKIVNFLKFGFNLLTGGSW